MATILPDLRGLHYIEFLRTIHRTFRPRSYLEIGARTGDSLKLASCPSIAVDPSISIDGEAIGEKPMCLLYQGTSDQYFATQDARQLLGRAVDLAFLDGLHQFEFLLRDFIGTERICNPGSLIAMHDCIPTDVYIAERDDLPERRRSMGSKPGWWTGDVWKMIPILKHWRPDVTMIGLDCMPTGLLLVTALNPGSRLLAENYRHIVGEFAEVQLADYGLERFHDEAEVQDAASARLPIQPWSHRRRD